MEDMPSLPSSWPLESLCALDLETTSVDVENARICQWAFIVLRSAEPPLQQGTLIFHSALVDPGIPMPAEAQAIHGFSTEYLSRYGEPPERAVPDVAARLRAAWEKGMPVVIYNAPYDLTVLDRELRRRGMPSGLGKVGPVIDPYILDRIVDPYRKGSRRLADVARYRNVKGSDTESLHRASTDALLALRLAVGFGLSFPELGRSNLKKLQRRQAECHREWAEHYNLWLDHQARTPNAHPYWPIIPIARPSRTSRVARLPA